MDYVCQIDWDKLGLWVGSIGSILGGVATIFVGLFAYKISRVQTNISKVSQQIEVASMYSKHFTEVINAMNKIIFLIMDITNIPTEVFVDKLINEVVRIKGLALEAEITLTKEIYQELETLANQVDRFHILAINAKRSNNFIDDNFANMMQSYQTIFIYTQIYDTLRKLYKSCPSPTAKY